MIPAQEPKQQQILGSWYAGIREDVKYTLRLLGTDDIGIVGGCLGKTKYGETGKLRYWHIEIIEYWSFPQLKYWNIRILEYWNIGILGYLEYYAGIIIGYCNTGTL